ncbi:LicD family protein [Oribacterium sp. WCC10]|uniref:LicD family protein n=1 Tax=Oribacterium sp. WCC10 TaxID=1855343 RepID=UPI0008E3EE4F|nr:LicD family protein [Oribacterium sp. WCC10]SFG25249.1 Phosphorylcholine metabolism protein LicD [Oribacterium sp. WCC10]
MDFHEGFYEDEVRNGFYIPSLMKRNWAAGLEVLSEIDKICVKYGLQWFMCFGTLLGAVRHKGFTAWDDDLDIMMKRRDFEVLKKHRDELPENYVIVSVQDTEDYNSPMASINNDKSALISPDQVAKHHGFPFNAGVDVYMLDGVSDDTEAEAKRMEHIHSLMKLCDDLNREKGPGQENLLLRFEQEFGTKFVLDETLTHQIYRELDRVSMKFSMEETRKLVYMYLHMENGGHVYDSEMFKTSIKVPFESNALSAPPGYDEFLKMCYGEYAKIHKGTSMHDYPVYVKWEKQVLEQGASLPYLYKFDKEALRHDRPKRMTVKEKNVGLLMKLSELCTLAKKVNDAGRYDMLSEIMTLCQNTAVKLGEELERSIISPERTVSELETFCELAYKVYVEADEYFGKLISENGGSNLQGQAEVTAQNLDGLYSVNSIERELVEYIPEMQARLKMVDESLMDAEEKTEIVILPFKASAWETMKPYYDRYKDDPTVNLHVVPIPYYRRGRDTSSGSEIYEGEVLSEKVAIEDYRTFPFEDIKPHVIVIQNPYDEYSMGSEVNRYFFSDNLMKMCDKLVYIPWFVTDDIDIDDEKCRLDIANMRHYVTVPGCVSADLIYVPTENLRKSYIRVLTEFCGEDTKERWEKRVQVML